MGSFPSVVCPEIVFGMLTDILFQHLKEAARDLIFLQGVRFLGDQAERTGIIPAARTAHLYVVNGIIHLAHDAFGAGEHPCLMSHERNPQMNVLPFRRLVGNISEEIHHPFTLVLHQIAQDVFLRNRHYMGMGAQLVEDIIHHVIAQRLVDKS